MKRQQLIERIAIGLGFGAALAIVGAIGAFALVQIRVALDAGDSYVRSWEVLRQSAVVQKQLLDSESGQRGYILTGDARYLHVRTGASGSAGGRPQARTPGRR